MNEQEYDDLMEVGIHGDVREDVKVMGLGLSDVLWIAIITIGFGFIVFTMPIGFVIKMIVTISLFLSSLLWRWLEIGYRLKRFKHDVYSADDGLGEEMDELLGVQEDGIFYRSGNDIQLILQVQVPPWMHAKRNEKISRVAAFEAFLRACVIEGFDAEILSEQIPDFQHGIWNYQRSRSYASEGIQKLSLARVVRQEKQAHEGQARRSQYTISLRIPEFRIKARQRDNEPSDVSRAELHRHRMVAELLEKQKRVCSSLQGTGHRIERVAGFVMPELLARTWAPLSWINWKANQENWQEPIEEFSDAIIPYEQLDYTIYPDQEEEPVTTRPTEEVEELDAESYEQLVQIAKGESLAEESETDVQKRKTLSDIWVLLVQAMMKLVNKGKEELQALRMKLKRSSNEKPVVETDVEESSTEAETDMISSVPWNTDQDDDTEDIILDYVQSHELNGVFWLSAPISAGQSFLATNVAAARALQGQRVTLIDLSVDRGTITLVNPKINTDAPISSKFEYWVSEQIKRRNQRLLHVVTPVVDVLSYPTVDEIISVIEEHKQYGLVLIDLPWYFPGAEQLRLRYPGAGIIDSNYHHWLQWVKEADTWSHDLWLNQVDSEMEERFQSLIKIQFKRPASAVFPLFQAASKYSYSGRPLAFSGQYRSYFMFQNDHSEEEKEHVQDTA